MTRETCLKASVARLSNIVRKESENSLLIEGYRRENEGRQVEQAPIGRGNRFDHSSSADVGSQVPVTRFCTKQFEKTREKDWM